MTLTRRNVSGSVEVSNKSLPDKTYKASSWKKNLKISNDEFKLIPPDDKICAQVKLEVLV